MIYLKCFNESNNNQNENVKVFSNEDLLSLINNAVINNNNHLLQQILPETKNLILNNIVNFNRLNNVIVNIINDTNINLYNSLQVAINILRLIEFQKNTDEIFLNSDNLFSNSNIINRKMQNLINVLYLCSKSMFNNENIVIQNTILLVKKNYFSIKELQNTFVQNDKIINAVNQYITHNNINITIDKDQELKNCLQFDFENYSNYFVEKNNIQDLYQMVSRLSYKIEIGDFNFNIMFCNINTYIIDILKDLNKFNVIDKWIYIFKIIEYQRTTYFLFFQTNIDRFSNSDQINQKVNQFIENTYLNLLLHYNKDISKQYLKAIIKTTYTQMFEISAIGVNNKHISNYVDHYIEKNIK